MYSALRFTQRWKLPHRHVRRYRIVTQPCRYACRSSYRGRAWPETRSGMVQNAGGQILSSISGHRICMGSLNVIPSQAMSPALTHRSSSGYAATNYRLTKATPLPLKKRELVTAPGRPPQFIELATTAPLFKTFSTTATCPTGSAP